MLLVAVTQPSTWLLFARRTGQNMPRPRPTKRAGLTIDGFYVKCDSDNRPGDLVRIPTGHYSALVRVYPQQEQPENSPAFVQDVFQLERDS